MKDPIDMTYWEMWTCLDRNTRSAIAHQMQEYDKRTDHFVKNRKDWLAMQIEQCAYDLYDWWCDEGCLEEKGDQDFDAYHESEDYRA